MRRALTGSVLMCCFVAMFSVTAGAAALPAPQTEGGMGLFEALNRRASAHGGDFPTGSLTPEDLSSVLWAATGLNRKGGGWTVPMSKGLEPYCRVYVAAKEGIFLYDWQNNDLEKISEKDVRGTVGAQNFVRNAPTILILVSDKKGLSNFEEPDRTAFAWVAVGAMTQDIYLASAALGLGTRYIHSMNEDEIRTVLALDEGEIPLCLMMLGK